MFSAVDRFLNSITMYKLVLYGLLFVSFCAVVLGFAGKLYYGGWQLLVGLAIAVWACYGSNLAFAAWFKAPATAESSAITGLILFLIMQPPVDWASGIALALAAALAMASKYLVAWRAKHVFNPAAVTAAVFGFTKFVAIWWVANPYLIWPVLIVGALVVRKIKRFPLFFAAVAGFYASYFFIGGNAISLASAWQALASWPIVFFAAIMLTEPSTLMPGPWRRMAYGFAIGLFLGSPVHLFGRQYTTPEFTLVIGNLVAFAFSLKGKIRMRLEGVRQLSATAHEFLFKPDRGFAFKPGQYLEWSLPHRFQDARGIRRYFTIASAPGDAMVRLGIRFSGQSSSFKKHLKNLKAGEELWAGQLDGSFTLPKNPEEKLLFFARGIGITPFVSMIRDLLAKKEQRDIVLFYANKTLDMPYMDLLKEAEFAGVKTVYVIDEESHLEGVDAREGPVGEQIIKELAPDYAGRRVYLSGPSAMVDNYKALVRRMGVPFWKIKTDYFPGF